MLGKDRIINCLSRAVRKSPADATIISLYRKSRHISRFSKEKLHQNLNEDEISIYIKVIVDRRCGVSITNSLERARLEHTIDSALRIASVSPKNPILGALAKKVGQGTVKTYFPQTARFTQLEMAEEIKRIISEARLNNVTIAGTFLTGQDEMAVVNSAGLSLYQPFTIASIKLISMRGSTSGFAQSTGRDISKLNIEGTLENAIHKSKLIHKYEPKDIKLGGYDCILEPDAVAEILMWLGYIGFGAKLFREHRSFVSGRIGDRIMSKALTIYDNGISEEGLAFPFDFEGFSKKRVELIKGGVVKGIVYDSDYATLYGRASTGHALPPDDPEGPLPLNLFIAPGNSTLSKMVSSLSKGILITRFHYVNGYLNPREALMTGLTRDGTFLIEKGKPIAALKNLRFTHSILDAFSKIRLISKETKLVSDPSQEMGSCVVPALLIEGFNFTGKTE